MFLQKNIWLASSSSEGVGAEGVFAGRFGDEVLLAEGAGIAGAFGGVNVTGKSSSRSNSPDLKNT